MQVRARRQVERHVEARRARIVIQASTCKLAGRVRLDLQRRATSRSKLTEMLRASPSPYCPASACEMRAAISVRGDGAACARDDDFGEPAGVDVDELVRPDRFDDAIGRAPRRVVPRSGARKIGTSATGAGILDQVADAHDVAGDGDAGAQRRRVCAAAGSASGAASAKQEAESDGCGRGSSAKPFSAHQLRGRLQHLVRRGDDLGIHLVGALRGDQVGDFGDRLDVGLFEAALQQRAGAVGRRHAVLRRAGSRRGGEQVVAVGLQAGIVDEASSA